MKLTSSTTWRLASWRRNKVSHKLIAQLRKDNPNVTFIRFGKSHTYHIEGSEDDLAKVIDRLEFQQGRV